MPINIISNIPMIYQFVLHIQDLSVISAASIPLAHCKAIFATNAFNFECLHTMYITTNVIIIVTNAAENRSTSTRKLLRTKVGVFHCSFYLLFPFISIIFSLCLYWFTSSFSVFGALSNIRLISKVSTAIGITCS